MRISSVIAIFTLASFTGAASLQATAADSPVAVEYYDLELNHFFVTAAADEIQALNSGRFFGWVATGLRFPVLAPGDLKAGSTPVCCACRTNGSLRTCSAGTGPPSTISRFIRACRSSATTEFAFAISRQCFRTPPFPQPFLTSSRRRGRRRKVKMSRVLRR